MNARCSAPRTTASSRPLALQTTPSPADSPFGGQKSLPKRVGGPGLAGGPTRSLQRHALLVAGGDGARTAASGSCWKRPDIGLCQRRTQVREVPHSWSPVWTIPRLIHRLELANNLSHSLGIKSRPNHHCGPACAGRIHHRNLGKSEVAVFRGGITGKVSNYTREFVNVLHPKLSCL